MITEAIFRKALTKLERKSRELISTMVHTSVLLQGAAGFRAEVHQCPFFTDVFNSLPMRYQPQKRADKSHADRTVTQGRY